MLAYKVAESEGKRVIVTLEIPEDAITNMKRIDVMDINSAKHRTNKAKVLSIEDKDGNTYLEAKSYIYRIRKLTYTVGDIIHVKNYDDNLDNVCSTGIHYFLSKEVAEMHELNTNERNGFFIQYYDNGSKMFECTYVNGKEEGLYISWYMNGKKSSETMYINGLREGFNKEYSVNGNIIYEHNYKNGNLHGICKNYFHHKNKVELEQNYNNGVLDGLSIKYEIGNTFQIETLYKDGKVVSTKTVFYKK